MCISWLLWISFCKELHCHMTVGPDNHEIINRGKLFCHVSSVIDFLGQTFHGSHWRWWPWLLISRHHNVDFSGLEWNISTTFATTARHTNQTFTTLTHSKIYLDQLQMGQWTFYQTSSTVSLCLLKRDSLLCRFQTLNNDNLCQFFYNRTTSTCLTVAYLYCYN